jgi:hypothetical protein
MQDTYMPYFLPPVGKCFGTQAWFSPPAPSSGQRASRCFGGQAPHDYSWFGFFDVMDDGSFLTIKKLQSKCQSVEP